MHTFVPSTCPRFAWQCLLKSSTVEVSPGIPNARTRMTVMVPRHWREMSSLPVPSAFFSVVTTLVGRGVVIAVELLLALVRFTCGLLGCLHCLPTSVPFPRLNPLPLVFLVGSVLTSWGLFVRFVSFCWNLMVVGWVLYFVDWVRFVKLQVAERGCVVEGSLEMPGKTTQRIVVAKLAHNPHIAEYSRDLVE